jgi:hypothetical protein
MSYLWLTILALAWSAFSDAWRVLVRALLLPACVLTYLALIKPEDPFYVRVLYSAAECLVTVTFAVTTHRIILLRLDLPPWGALSWSKRETRFLWWWLLSGILLSISLFPLFVRNLVEPPAIWGFLAPAQVIAFFLGARLSLILPAIAIGEPSKPSEVWCLSRGNVLQVVFALAVPLFAFLGLWILVPKDAAPIEFTTIQVLIGLAGCLTTAFEITVLSVCYRELKSRAAA